MITHALRRLVAPIALLVVTLTLVPTHRAEATSILPPAPTVPARDLRPPSVPFRFIATQQGLPVRWDPCKPIHYRVSWGPLETTQHANLDAAIARASAATGITFVYDGPASTVPTKANWPHAGVAGTDLLIAYSLPGTVGGRSDILDGLTAGVAQSVTDGGGLFTEGMIVIDRRAIREQDYTPRDNRHVLLHELGHILGLDHTSDLRQVMAYGYVWDDRWAIGDLAGLRRLGRTAGCPTAPAPVTGLAVTRRHDGRFIATWDPWGDSNVGGGFEVAVERTGATSLSYDFPTDATTADFWPEREHVEGDAPFSLTVRVRAVNAARASHWSTATVTTMAEAPDALTATPERQAAALQ